MGGVLGQVPEALLEDEPAHAGLRAMPLAELGGGNRAGRATSGLLEQCEPHRHPGRAGHEPHAPLEGRLVLLEGAVQQPYLRGRGGRRRRRRGERGGDERGCGQGTTHA
jgi:hypothetical protein